MKATRRNRWSLRAPVLLAAVAGLALSASGCIIDGSTGPDICLPDLTIRWQIVSMIDGQILTCAEAGGADTITAEIDGGAYGSALQYFPTACPSSATSGSFKVELPTADSYNVSLNLTAGADSRSTTNVLFQPVDCSGLTTTPEAPLYVNF